METKAAFLDLHMKYAKILEIINEIGDILIFLNIDLLNEEKQARVRGLSKNLEELGVRCNDLIYDLNELSDSD